jgi:hypothetical protein
MISLALTLAACSCAGIGTRPSEPIPPFMLGELIDDYGIRYSVTAEEWVQLPNTRYRIRSWHVSERYLLAENDAANAEHGGLWTRIDWVQLEDGGEYGWAFCYAVYEAATMADAAAAPPSQRRSPRAGCNGYPFSRMKPAAPRPAARPVAHAQAKLWPPMGPNASSISPQRNRPE